MNRTSQEPHQSDSAANLSVGIGAGQLDPNPVRVFDVGEPTVPLGEGWVPGPGPFRPQLPVRPLDILALERDVVQLVPRHTTARNACSLALPCPSRGDMIQIDMEVPDRPGELAKLAAILGEAGINIDAIGAESAGGRSYVSLIVNQPMQAREAIMKSGYTCSMRTVLVVRLDDKPGALAALARKLGDAGVDVVSAIHLGTVGGHAQVALGVDNLERARSLV